MNCPNCKTDMEPQQYYTRYGPLPQQVYTAVRKWVCPKCQSIHQSAAEWLKEQKRDKN